MSKKQTPTPDALNDRAGSLPEESGLEGASSSILASHDFCFPLTGSAPKPKTSVRALIKPSIRRLLSSLRHPLLLLILATLLTSIIVPKLSQTSRLHDERLKKALENRC